MAPDCTRLKLPSNFVAMLLRFTTSLVTPVPTVLSRPRMLVSAVPVTLSVGVVVVVLVWVRWLSAALIRVTPLRAIVIRPRSLATRRLRSVTACLVTYCRRWGENFC